MCENNVLKCLASHDSRSTVHFCSSRVAAYSVRFLKIMRQAKCVYLMNSTIAAKRTLQVYFDTVAINLFGRKKQLQSPST
jgi:hypothetical protein